MPRVAGGDGAGRGVPRMTCLNRATGCPITVDEWLSLVDKRDLQDFQDCFAAETGIALALVGRAGDELLVPSKDRWFCDFSKIHFAHRCSICADNLVRRLIKRYEVRRDFEPTMVSCDFGLTECYVPVYYDNHLIAFWQGGGFTLSGQYRAEMLERKFDVVVLAPEELKRCMRRLVATTKLLNVQASAADAAVQPARSNAVFDGKLTRREQEVAGLVCRGMSNREVAQQLFLSEKTIKSHMSNILSKLGVRDRTQLIFEFNNRYAPVPDTRMSA